MSNAPFLYTKPNQDNLDGHFSEIIMVIQSLYILYGPKSWAYSGLFHNGVTHHGASQPDTRWIASSISKLLCNQKIIISWMTINRINLYTLIILLQSI